MTRLLIPFLIGASVLSAQTVSTDPVGYITVNVAGTGGAGSAKISIIGSPMHGAVLASGSLTSAAGTTLNSTSSSLTDSAYSSSHYIQITSGANTGVTSAITGNTATSVSTSDDLSSLLSGDETFAIRAFTTLGDIFGAANESGIGGGANSNVADEILVYNGSSFDVYYYQDGAPFGGTGWRSSTNGFSSAANTVIPHGLSIVVKRKQADDVALVLSGSVFTTDTSVPVESGVNWLAGSHPVNYTLASYFGADGGNIGKGANSSVADEILVPNGNGGFNIYYYQDGAPFGGTGWRSSTNGFSDAGSTVVASAGSGFVIKAKNGAYNVNDATPLD